MSGRCSAPSGHQAHSQDSPVREKVGATCKATKGAPLPVGHFTFL